MAPANAHDSTLIEGILEAVVVERPTPTPEDPQRLCLDKAFDTPAAQETVAKEQYESHTRRIGEETKPCDPATGHKPRRWVVERTIGWLNRCRALLIRFDKHAQNYLGLMQLACALIWWRRYAKIFGDPVLG